MANQSSDGPRFGFPVALRVRRTGDYQSIQGRGKRAHGQNLVLAYQPNRAGRTRIGMTISAKQGNAPVRNRFKRLVREVFRLTRTMWPTGFDYVVIARNPKAIRSYRDMEVALAQVVERVGRR